MNSVTPQIKAMLLCDDILTDQATQKKSLIGIFENIRFEGNPPWRHPTMSVYIKFTDAEGKYNFRVELIDLQNNTKIGEGTFPSISVQNRLASHELAFQLQGLQFNREGRYQFNLYANEKVFGSKDFNVMASSKES